MNALSLLLLLVASLHGAAAQPFQQPDVGQCRGLMVSCLSSCTSGCGSSDTDCKLTCKRTCAAEYECPFTRDFWPAARTEWCCACRGVRC